MVCCPEQASVLRALNTDPAWRDGDVSEGIKRKRLGLASGASEGHSSGEGRAAKLT